MHLNSLALACVLFTASFRLAEIVLGDINAHKMLAQRQGREFSRWQRLPIVLIYMGWLAALLLCTPTNAVPELAFLVLFALLQILRWWAIAHLKDFWTMRIVVVPLAFKITGGPYRFLKHPIYVVLVGEVLALSLAFQQNVIALLFGAAIWLWVFIRLRSENRALSMML